jgi:hypothetical protein
LTVHRNTFLVDIRPIFNYSPYIAKVTGAQKAVEVEVNKRRGVGKCKDRTYRSFLGGKQLLFSTPFAFFFDGAKSCKAGRIDDVNVV